MEQKKPQKGAEKLPYPAFLLDENKKIVSRSSAAHPRLLPFRMRAMIDHYLSKADRKRLSELPEGGEILIDLQHLTPHGAIAYRYADGYWVAMREMTALLLSCVQKHGEDTPPFFAQVEQQIQSVCEESEELPRDPLILRKNFRQMLRYHAEMVVFLRCASCKFDTDAACEMTSPVESLLKEALRFLRPNGFRPMVKTVEGPVYVCGSADELRYALATMISTAAEHARERRSISIRSAVLENACHLSVSFEPLMEGEPYRTALSGNYAEGLSTAFGSLFFDLLLLEKLAAANGWRFSVANAGNTDGVLCMNLALPLSDKRPARLSEAPSSLSLMKLMFAFLLPLPEDRA